MGKEMKATPYAQINGVNYYKAKDVANYINRSVQTLALWDKWSDDMQQQGKARYIPPCVRIGNTRTKCWSLEQIESIAIFARRMGYGDLANHTRKRRHQENISQDRSTETRNSVKKYRHQVDVVAKRISKKEQKRIEREQKKQMLANLKRSAKEITKIK